MLTNQSRFRSDLLTRCFPCPFPDPGGELGGSARGPGHHEGAVLYRETKSSPSSHRYRLKSSSENLSLKHQKSSSLNAPPPHRRAPGRSSSVHLCLGREAGGWHACPSECVHSFCSWARGYRGSSQCFLPLGAGVGRKRKLKSWSSYEEIMNKI